VWIYQQQRIYLTENSMLCCGPLVSELGGGRVHGAPNPVIGGAVPPGSAAYGSGKKGGPYSITERRVPELIPVLGSQPAGGVSHKPAVGCYYFPQACSCPLNP